MTRPRMHGCTPSLTRFIGPAGAADDVARLMVGKVVTVTVRGTPVKLEIGATGDAKGMADGLARAEAAA